MNQAYLSECGDGQERQKHLSLPWILSVRWVLQLCQCLIVDARLTNNTALIFWPVSDGDNEFYYPGPGGVGGGCHYLQTHDVSTHSLDWPERRPGQIIQSRLFNCSNSQGREPSSERGEALSGVSCLVCLASVAPWYWQVVGSPLMRTQESGARPGWIENRGEILTDLATSHIHLGITGVG